MMDKPKVIVAHPGRQHSFRVAKALKDGGMLYKYATTVYNKESSILMRIIKLFLNKDNYDRAQRRKCNDLKDDDVVQFCEIDGLLLLALQRIDFTRYFSVKYNGYISRKFQRKLAKYIINNNVDAVVSYDTNSAILFRLLKANAPQVKLIMDNAHPNRHYLYHSYHEHWDSVGDFYRTLDACGYLTNEERSEKFGLEAKLADYHIVASSYSEKALVYDNIPLDNIYRVPYGVDKNKFLEPKRVYDGKQLTVLFVGEVNQRKGIKQVLEAAKRINSEDVIFNIVGSGREYCADLYEPYKPYVNFMGRVPFSELLNQLQTSHVFIFPTMGEGFGLVLLEAMAAGLPVITTANCGGADIVSEGDNGFLIDACDENALISKIKWFLNNQDKMQRMSKRAIETARLFTWERYESGIVNAVSNIINRKKL